MIQVQFDLFKTPEECRMDALECEIVDTKKSCDKVRKGLFARNNELKKRIDELEERFAILEKNLCTRV